MPELQVVGEAAGECYASACFQKLRVIYVFADLPDHGYRRIQMTQTIELNQLLDKV
ncbi:hypothetical protein ACTXT7_002402 [Hymenolepis weldensis]